MKSKSNFPLLQDVDGGLLASLDLLHKGGNPLNGNDIARPALVLFDKQGKVIWSKATENYRVRPTPEDILKEIQ
jgi:peroxiredoxin